MAHRLTDEAGAPSPFAVAGSGMMTAAAALAIGSMTSAERARGRYMRAPDGHDGGGADTGAPLGFAEGVAALMAPPAAAEGGEEKQDEQQAEPGADEQPLGDHETEQDEGGISESDEEAATDEDEQHEAAAIEPPVSWNAEDKEVFAQLSPEAQAVVARRESEREKAFQAKATEAAQAKNAAQREAQQHVDAAVTELQTQFATRLESYLATDGVQRPDPDWLDVAKYGDEGPKAFYAQQAVYEADQAQRVQAKEDLAKTREATTQRQQEARNAFLAEQAAILADPEQGIPGWRDPVEGTKIKTALSELASAHGFAERIADADAVDLKFLHTAMSWKAKADQLDELNSKKMAVVRQAKTLPKVAKPGGQGQVREGAQATRRVDALSSFSQTRSAADAAALLMVRKR